jgi:alpha-amylase
MKKYLPIFLIYIFYSFLISGCSSIQNIGTPGKVSKWPHAISYEIFVHAFYDSNGDGIGDINGMTSKLDYLQELGIEAIWLMPINPSPSYHKYDVTDYYAIHPEYGTMDDFKNFIKEAHERNIKVVIDLVINHTAKAHPWFQSAMRDKNSPFRDYYVWADANDITEEQNKKEISADSDNTRHWHAVEGTTDLYYGYFYGGMPDLNFDNPVLKEEIFKIGKFWLTEVGVDGFRLDAARHIFPDDRPEDNHIWWVEFRNEMEKVKEDVVMVGEVWADANTVAPYLKGLHSLFNFDMGYAITRSVNEEKEGDLITKHKEILDFYHKVTPNFVDATFITNHDQNRIMSEVNGDANKAKMAASLLLTLPGSPYIYYGEEIGMKGRKPDPFIREPFLWDSAEQDPGQTKWLKAKFSTENNVTPLSLQFDNASSMFNHYKNLIHFRNSNKALSFGNLELSEMKIEGICSFKRTYEDETVLVIHNLTNSINNMNLSSNNYTIIFSTNGKSTIKKEILNLEPHSSVVLEKK